MATHSHDLRAWLHQGTRSWHLLAVPTTLVIAIVLLTQGKSQALSPRTEALTAYSADAPLLSDNSTDRVTLIYHDTGRPKPGTPSTAGEQPTSP
ncbi:MAG: hypothetical protein AAGA11_01410 [Pseudomonadota bacterium]